MHNCICLKTSPLIVLLVCFLSSALKPRDSLACPLPYSTMTIRPLFTYCSGRAFQAAPWKGSHWVKNVYLYSISPGKTASTDGQKDSRENERLLSRCSSQKHSPLSTDSSTSIYQDTWFIASIPVARLGSEEHIGKYDIIRKLQAFLLSRHIPARLLPLMLEKVVILISSLRDSLWDNFFQTDRKWGSI